MPRFPACILATCVVPWDEQGRFIEGLFVDQVRRLLKLTPHLYTFGTAGEGYAVDDEQFATITESFVRTMQAGGGEPMVGVISLSPATIQRRIGAARDLGVRRFQISLPSWGELNNTEIDAFFAAVCGRFPDCEFLHYNLLRTKRLITPEEYAELADRHKNLVATKNSTDVIGRLNGLLRTASQLQHFITEPGFGYAAGIDKCGLLASTSTLQHGGCRALIEAVERRDTLELTRIGAELTLVGRELRSAVGPGPHMDGAFDKLLWRMHDDRFPLRLLPPYQGAPDDAVQKFREGLARSVPQWLPDSQS
jgi:dihydrodipicolinate synthase/N-acetylneuraminate lyase